MSKNKLQEKIIVAIQTSSPKQTIIPQNIPHDQSIKTSISSLPSFTETPAFAQNSNDDNLASAIKAHATTKKHLYPYTTQSSKSRDNQAKQDTCSNNESELLQTHAILKKVLPLMGKYKIPASPEHYAVWYTYCAQTNEDITQKLDKAIANNEIINSLTSKEIYQECIEYQNSLACVELKQTLEALLIELSGSFSDTIKNTNNFSEIIDGSLEHLNKTGPNISIDETVYLVQRLVQSSKYIKKQTEAFVDQLLKTQNEITDLKNKLAQAQADAIHDALTGLYNRRAFDKEGLDLQNNNTPFSIIMFDIDHFKVINDTYGHNFGDSVLKAVSKVIKNVFAQTKAHAFRIGGEEFVIILPNCHLQSAVRLADSCRRHIEKITIKHIHSNKIVSSIRASFGVATKSPNDTFSEVTEQADQMLYLAKAQGRNRVMPIIM